MSADTSYTFAEVFSYGRGVEDSDGRKARRSTDYIVEGTWKPDHGITVTSVQRLCSTDDTNLLTSKIVAHRDTAEAVRDAFELHMDLKLHLEFCEMEDA